MFEKWRIKEHMEVVNAAGRHIGTVDGMDGDLIKLTRTDSTDSRHHRIDVDCVERVSDNRVELKDGVPLPEGLGETGLQSGAQSDAAKPADSSQDGIRPGVDAASISSATSDVSTSESMPLFGTSGRGTGMGGSGIN